VEELARSLDELETAPTSGGRDRGLRASFDHSWRMLTPAERDVLPRLAVFVGTFSRAAVEQVAQAPFSVLGALVDKSLLRAAGDGRFSLHVLLRQCALERLPYPQAARLRHAEHYAQFLARCGDRVEARSANAMIEPDLQNCLVAWQTLVEADLPASIEKMASPLGRFFDLRGRLDEGITLLQPVVHLFDTARARQARPYGRLQWNLANLLFRKAGFAEAESAARLALRAFVSARANVQRSHGRLSLGEPVLRKKTYRCFRARRKLLLDIEVSNSVKRFHPSLLTDTRAAPIDDKTSRVFARARVPRRSEYTARMNHAHQRARCVSGLAVPVVEISVGAMHLALAEQWSRGLCICEVLRRIWVLANLRRFLGAY